MEDLDYQIDRGKRKNVYISIQDDKVVVKIPKRFPEYKIKEILIKKGVKDNSCIIKEILIKQKVKEKGYGRF